MRLLNMLVIAALIVAATYVYKIKFDSTLQAERVAKMHLEIRKERNAIASLRAEWAELETPGRIQALAERHLKLRSMQSNQIDTFDNLPPRPSAPAPAADPIGAMLTPSAPETTGSIPAPAAR
jgi:cell division protein FtsL